MTFINQIIPLFSILFTLSTLMVSPLKAALSADAAPFFPTTESVVGSDKKHVIFNPTVTIHQIPSREEARAEEQGIEASNKLLKALCICDDVTVHKMLRDGVNPNTCNDKGELLLNQACRSGYYSIIDYLLMRKKPSQYSPYPVNVDLRDDKGKTPLHHAMYYSASTNKTKNCFNVVNALLKDGGADANMPDTAGKSPLSYAIDYYYYSKNPWDNGLDLIILLLKHGAIITDDIWERADDKIRIALIDSI